MKVKMEKKSFKSLYADLYNYNTTLASKIRRLILRQQTILEELEEMYATLNTIERQGYNIFKALQKKIPADENPRA